MCISIKLEIFLTDVKLCFYKDFCKNLQYLIADGFTFPKQKKTTLTVKYFFIVRSNRLVL